MGIDSPLFFHLDRKPSWQQTHWIANGKKVVEYLQKTSSQLPDDIADARQKFFGRQVISEETLRLFGPWCLRFRDVTLLIISILDVDHADLLALRDLPRSGRLADGRGHWRRG